MPTIEYRMDTTGIPHTYIVVNNGAGTQQMYGFAPATSGNLWGKGHIYDESVSGQDGGPHLWDHTTGPIEVTADQYNRVVAEINKAIANPPYYNLPASISFPNAVNQCATWADHLADVGGFRDKMPWGSNGWNPYGQSVWTEISKYWKENPLGGGSLGINDIDYDINGNVNSNFLAAKSWTAPRDPLVLDLDGDGIETAGIDPTAPVLFDMDGDGVKTATGWIRPDDGIVVLDRNGNGLIDSGRELFGDATVLARGARAGQLAANGFEALADLDLNADGRLDSLDASWGQLRIWRDLNQDGVSQAGELTTLAAQGIASLGAQGTQSNVNLGGGNTQVMSGSFTRTNGMLGTSGVAEVAGSLLLASNNFYRDFTDEVALTPAAQSLPQMQGSGLVRDLREAMSLGTAQAGALRAAVSVFGAGSECSLNTPKSIAGCKSGSSANGRFDAQKRICGRRGLTRVASLVDGQIGAAGKTFMGNRLPDSVVPYTAQPAGDLGICE